MMAGQLDLSPGDSLGPFQLGTTLFNLLNLVRSHREAYPSIKIAWDEDTPSTSPIHIILTKPPLSLLFDPLTQRLTRIQVDKQAGAWVAYRGKSLRESGTAAGDEVDDVVKTVRRVMGPTYSSANGGGEGEEMLSYPGVAFGVVRKAGGADTQLSRIIVTPLPAPANIPADQAWLHPLLPESPAIAQGDLRLVEVKLDSLRKPSSVHLHFHPISTPPLVFQLGQTTNEDLLCDLGSPVRSFWKEDDRMSIHTSRTSLYPSLQPNPYFLSHPHLGLTFLLHPTKHVLLKIILHSNLPGQVNFGRTSRCAWDLVTSSGERASGADGFKGVSGILTGANGESGSGLLSVGGGGGSMQRSESIDSHQSGGSRSSGGGGGGGGGGKKKKRAEAEISPAPPTVIVDGEVERPMILDRTADGAEGDVKGRMTEIHGFPGIALEVTSTGDVETVWLF